MTTTIIECVPNFSDARRPEVIETIQSAIAAVDGVHVLDHHLDGDHNRTVITFVGSPAGVEEAAFQAIAKDAIEYFAFRTLDLIEPVLGSDHPYTMTAMSNVASVLISQERYAEAEPIAREVLEFFASRIQAIFTRS